jgi:hypothetical protein
MYPIHEIEKEMVKRSFGRLFDDVVGYLNLYDYIKLKAIDLTGKSKEISLPSFWYSVLGDKFSGAAQASFAPLKPGDIVTMKDVFITDWGPKLPGQIWTAQGVESLRQGQRRVDGYAQLRGGGFTLVLDPYGKEKSISAGLGSVRIKPDMRDKEYCAYLSLVSEENWQCDYGIPIVASRSVYEKFRKYSELGAPWVEKLEGVVHLHEDIPLKTLIPKAIGAKLSVETEETLRFRPNLPKAFIYVSSPLSMKLKYNNSHPLATAWTMYETDLRRSPFRYSYFVFSPTNANNFDEATEFLKGYAQQYDGKKIITDFDGIVPRLEASIPLSSNPMKKNKKEAKHLIEGLDDWVKSSFHRFKRRGY